MGSPQNRNSRGGGACEYRAATDRVPGAFLAASDTDAEVRECNPGRRLRRRISVGTIRDISIKHDIKHVVSVPLKSKAVP